MKLSHMSYRAFILLLLTAALSVLLYALGPEKITAIVMGDIDKKVSVNNLARQFEKFPLEESSRLISKAGLDKGPTTSFSAHVASTSINRDVLNYYERKSLEIGWRRALKNDKELKLCKSGISLIVQMMPSESGSKYYFGLTWVLYKNHPAFCP
ncbi:hypothetical protein VC218_12995 [Xanthomonas nasturtii]|uniref:hypothetical protein n=1 Tax=Xanthomonas nasturtii TaxID=1843581 RepID=UPI002B22A114|nr:hypothetical protein [Xanthomonas nasturtii]MEA9579781.1 hypothetical protein [Xanthomonas nasturtii]